MSFKDPTPAELNESAMNHFSRGNGIEAARQLQWALIRDPNYAEAWHNRALVLQALNDPFDAILCCEKALNLKLNAAYFNTLGVCWAKCEQYGKAEAAYRDALMYDDKLAPAWHNLASAARLGGNINDAVAHYEMAVNLRPDNPDYHVSYSSALLGAGRLAEGWHEYEYRFAVSDAFARNMPLPEWRGEPNATVVIYAEQGFGDTIQFLRFVNSLRNNAYNCKFIIEVKKPLVELVKQGIGVGIRGWRYEVIAYGDPIPSDATHCLPIMSTAKFAGINTIEDIKGDPYLSVPDFPIRDHTQLAISKCNGMRVGLCWSTGVRPHQPELREIAERKSIPLHFLKPLKEIEGINWFSLQLPNNDLPFDMINLTDQLFDFYETAKLMKQLNCVVTVDTSVAHLAGALDIPTIVMTPRDNCWRWFGDRSDVPWYNSMTQYRQKSPGDWPSVIERVVAHLSGE